MEVVVGGLVMATLAELEKRLEAVEQQLVELRRQEAAVAVPETNLEWAHRIAEAFKDIPPEDIEAMHRYGREFRESHTFPAEDGQ
jgi:hypothetical protein